MYDVLMNDRGAVDEPVAHNKMIALEDTAWYL
jgi:hypothetical protein